MTILGKLICALTGKHKRGKRVGSSAGAPVPEGILNEGYEVVVYACPRCQTQWLRKVKS